MTYLHISPDVKIALYERRPVVALESTVISHGLPYPHNYELAHEIQEIVREHGATPATIAVADGSVHVGCDDILIDRLVTERMVEKVSLRNLGLVLADRGLGATTVATTMWAAHKAGIRVFATGGIGGVHLGDHGDVSADLPALATIPVCVVSSGPKAILDLPRTREWLETWGVPILGWRSAEMPAFYSRESGLLVDRAVSDASEAAHYIKIHLSLKHSGLLLGVPVPYADALPNEMVSAWVAEAHKNIEDAGIEGANVTPHLLSDLGRLSQGKTLQANLALLKHNAAVAAEVSVKLAR